VQPANDPIDTCDVRILHRDRVDDTRRRIPAPEPAARLAETFKVLADPGRIRIISALAASGELCVCDLAAVVGTSESAMSHQLRMLRDRGLVTFRKDGRVAYYRLADDHVRVILDTAAAHERHDGTSR